MICYNNGIKNDRGYIHILWIIISIRDVCWFSKIQKESEIISISFIYQSAQNGCWVQNIITGMKTTMREKRVTGKNRWYVKEEQYKIYTVGSTSMKVKSTINNEKVITIAYN